MAIPGAAEKIRAEVGSWPGVRSSPHRFGGTEFRLGTRELGHLHGDHLVDIPFPRRVRDRLVADGAAQPHHVLPETGWISFYLREESDVSRAIDLFRQSYEIAVQQHDRKGAA